MIFISLKLNVGPVMGWREDSLILEVLSDINRSLADNIVGLLCHDI
jgi:hypothetical protein